MQVSMCCDGSLNRVVFTDVEARLFGALETYLGGTR